MSSSTPFVLAQLSDIHLCPPAQMAYGCIDTAQHFRRTVSTLQNLPTPPDAILITGDLTDKGDLASYSYLRELLLPLQNIPTWVLPGNHDQRANLREVFAAESAANEVDSCQQFIQYSVKLGSMRLVALDSSVPDHDHGALCAQRLAWLDQTLRRHQDEKVIIALHHPPFKTHLQHMDAVTLIEGREEFFAVLKRHTNIERIICGHIHRAIHTFVDQTMISVAPSCSHHIAWNLNHAHSGAWTQEPPGFYLHSFIAGQPLITHLMTCGHYPAKPFCQAA